MSTKPRWSPDDAKRRARIAYRLATKHQAAVEPRLSPGLLAQLAADRTALGDASVGSLSALATQKTATATERDLAAKGHRLALRVREVIRRSPNAPAHLWAALGIGDALRPGDTAGVAAALDALADDEVAAARAASAARAPAFAWGPLAEQTLALFDDVALAAGR